MFIFFHFPQSTLFECKGLRIVHFDLKSLSTSLTRSISKLFCHATIELKMKIYLYLNSSVLCLTLVTGMRRIKRVDKS